MPGFMFSCDPGLNARDREGPKKAPSAGLADGALFLLNACFLVPEKAVVIVYRFPLGIKIQIMVSLVNRASR